MIYMTYIEAWYFPTTKEWIRQKQLYDYHMHLHMYIHYLITYLVPQIAIAIGVLTSNRGVTTNFGGVDVVPLQGAIVVCCGWGTLGGGGLGAIAGCHCSVL